MTYIEKIYDISTGQTTERTYTKEEIAEMQAGELKAQERTAAQAQVEANKAAAQAKLAALGLTADDLKALGL